MLFTMITKAIFTITPKQPGKVFIKGFNGKKYLKDYTYSGSCEIISAKVIVHGDDNGDLWPTLVQLKYRFGEFMYEYNKARNSDKYPGDKYTVTRMNVKKPYSLRFWLDKDGLSKLHADRFKAHLMVWINGAADSTDELSNSLITDLEKKFGRLVR